MSLWTRARDRNKSNSKQKISKMHGMIINKQDFLKICKNHVCESVLTPIFSVLERFLLWKERCHQNLRGVFLLFIVYFLEIPLYNVFFNILLTAYSWDKSVQSLRLCSKSESNSSILIWFGLCQCLFVNDQSSFFSWLPLDLFIHCFKRVFEIPPDLLFTFFIFNTWAEESECNHATFQWEICVSKDGRYKQALIRRNVNLMCIFLNCK